MSKVVYLLGAGASYGRRDQTLSYQLEKKTSQGTVVSSGSCPKILEGMPVVNELPGRMEYISSLLWKDLNKYPISSIHRLPLTYFINALDWLQKESARHATIDTFDGKSSTPPPSIEAKNASYLLSALFNFCSSVK